MSDHVGGVVSPPDGAVFFSNVFFKNVDSLGHERIKLWSAFSGVTVTPQVAAAQMLRQSGED